MADTDNNNQKLSAAWPKRITEDSPTGLQINECKNNVFDMTAMLSAGRNYAALNQVVNLLIGMEVRWFRAAPQYRSQDVIFQEYTLSNVSDTPVCLKVVLPDGNFPDSKYNYDLMGLEYEVPLEIQIDKAYWESMSGYGTAPQKNDIVYFAVPNKLYEVVSSYLFRGFMEQPTTWKLNLRKYQPKASRKEGDILKDTIDKYTVSSEEIFGEKQQSDIQKITDDKQFSPHNTASEDYYKTMDDDLSIIPNQLDIYGMRVAESFYDLSTSTLYDAVKYNPQEGYTYMDKISTSDDRCISAWTLIDSGVVTEYEITSITENLTLSPPANYVLEVKTSRKASFEVGTYIEIYRPGALSFYAKIIDATQKLDNKYSILIDDAVIDHLTSIKSNWSTLNYKMKVQEPASILSGVYTDPSGNYAVFQVDIFANQYIKVVFHDQEHIAIMTDKMVEKDWYGIIVNIGNTWNQYNVYVYKQHDTDNGSKLKTVFYETLDFNPVDPGVTVSYYAINKSPSLITNIRLYNSTLEEEKQQKELLSYFSKDGDQLIIGDNADPKFRSPYISQQR